MVNWMIAAMFLGCIGFIMFGLFEVAKLNLRDEKIRRLGKVDNEVLEEMRRDYLFCSIFKEDEKLQAYEVYKTLSKKDHSNDGEAQMPWGG